MSNHTPPEIPAAQQLTQPSQEAASDDCVAAGGKFAERMKHWIPLVGAGTDSCRHCRCGGVDVADLVPACVAPPEKRKITWSDFDPNLDQKLSFARMQNHFPAELPLSFGMWIV